MDTSGSTSTYRGSKDGGSVSSSRSDRDSALESCGSESSAAAATASQQPNQGVKKHATAEHMMDKACDTGHTWRRYSKYLSSHWDRETSAAHHALDVILDHIKHPQYYRTEKSESYVNKARRNLYNVFEGILPSMARRGKEYGDEIYETGRNIHDKETGRSWYDKLTGRGLVDKAADAKDELIHNVRRGVDQAKDVSYEVGHKLSSLADSVKDKIAPKNGHARDEDQATHGGGSWFSGSWFGRGQRGEAQIRDHREDDEYGISTEKLRKVVRKAEREM